MTGAESISNTNVLPSFKFDDLPLEWQMTRAERYAFASLLETARPEVAIEVGTYRGGSLQLLAAAARKVYSLDISPDCAERLATRFGNVEFLTGDSKALLPPLLERIACDGEQLGFVLIDGDHSTAAVRADINAVLRYQPIRPLYVVFHDSFHPPSRQGILTAGWEACPWVHSVDVDFIQGVFHPKAVATAEPRSMYGGLCVAVLLPQPRAGPLAIQQSQRGLYEAVYARSRYASPRLRLADALRRLKRRWSG